MPQAKRTNAVSVDAAPPNDYRTVVMRTGMDATTDELLGGLNEPQRAAAAHTDGPLLILAGPGSGKTRVVTRRAAYLARTVAAPSQILAITFTNKAATEMRERIDALHAGGGMTVCTFHAFCAKLLRWYHERAGVPRNFTIFDRDDRRKVLKDAIERCDLSATNWSPAKVEPDISRAKNALLTPQAMADEVHDWRTETVARIYEAYESLLAEMAALDFDDLLMRIAVLLNEDADLRDELEDRFRYVLIDEYQDTNAAQYQIARLLTRERRNLCATGDPDQSIYGWRGADLRNILSFERDYPEARVVRLEQNYRSTRRILAAADALIVGNIERKEKSLWTDNDEGAKVNVVEVESGTDEAAAIAADIGRRLQAGASPQDIAVFYRVNSLSRVLEEALLRAGITYQIARGTEFYGRKEIKDVLAYLRVLINPADEVALLRIINTPPRGIGATTINRLIQRARNAGQSIFDAVRDAAALSHLGRSAGKVRDFAALFETLAAATALPAPQALEFVISHSGLRAYYGGEERPDDGPINNINELISAATEYQAEVPEATIVDWLEHTALIGDIDAVKDELGAVTLMTLHAAKGLEFAIVYIVGLEDGLLPLRPAGHADADHEEERRLLFVGMTRAKERLTLMRAQYRTQRGATLRTTRSPYLDELPRAQLEWRTEGAKPHRRSRSPETGQLPDDVEQWTIGTLVRHPECGLGRILSIQRSARRTHVKVQFQDGSRRSWVLEFADLTRVDFDDIGDLDTALGA